MIIRSAFGVRLPASVPEGRKRFPISLSGKLRLLLSPGREYGAFHLAEQVRRLDRESGVLRQDDVRFAFDGEPHYRFPQVFYDVDYLTQKWARWLRVVSVTPEAYGHQTALVLRKS